MDRAARGLLYSSFVEKRTTRRRTHNASLRSPSIGTYEDPTPSSARTSENASQPISNVRRPTSHSIAGFEGSTLRPSGIFGGTTPRSTRVTFEDNTSLPTGTFGGKTRRRKFERFLPRPIGKFGRPAPRPNDTSVSLTPQSTGTFGSPTPRSTGTIRSATSYPTGTFRSSAKHPAKQSEDPTPRAMAAVTNDHRRATYAPLSNKSNAPPASKIRFDEEQIRQHLLFKHYDYIGIPKAKTPVPRSAAPVDPDAVRDRLTAILDGSTRKSAQVRYTADVEELKDLSDLRTLEFLEKRKAFYFQEFTIAKQKIMNLGVFSLPPGPSIGEGWTTGGQSLSSMRRISCTRTSTVNAVDNSLRMSMVDPQNLRVSIGDMLALRINALNKRAVSEIEVHQIAQGDADEAKKDQPDLRCVDMEFVLDELLCDHNPYFAFLMTADYLHQIEYLNIAPKYFYSSLP
ncbi:hypothetical protein GQX74_011677 [Glossina fuscipes]|nr:hypothetical protein GQX74_011677 [Glossina fuscipes]